MTFLYHFFHLAWYSVILYFSLYQYLIPFYGWMIFPGMYIPHSVCHSCIDGLLGCSHFWLLWMVLLFVQLHSFACCGYQVVPAPFVEETLLFPLNGHGILVRNQLTTYVRFISGFSLLFHWSVCLYPSTTLFWLKLLCSWFSKLVSVSPLHYFSFSGFGYLGFLAILCEF